MNAQTVQILLKELKLTTAALELNEVLEETKGSVSFAWVVNTLQREVDARKERSLKGKIRRSQIPELKSIESFDWSFNPSINQEKLQSIASLDFIKDREIILFLGQPGTGKSHLATAIGLKAIVEGKSVYWSNVKKLAEEILLAKQKGELSKLFKRILSSNLWILDDWGLIGFDREVSEEVFDLLDRRRHTSSLILTSNRDISEWPEVFSDPVLASAAIDRIFDRANVTVFQGKSYRAEGKRGKNVEGLPKVKV